MKTKLERIVNASSYDDFLSDYGNEAKKLLKELQSYKDKIDNLTDDQWKRIQDKMKVYDKNVDSEIQHWMMTRGIEVRDIAQFAIENQNRYGTEARQIVNALEDFVNLLNRFLEE